MELWRDYKKMSYINFLKYLFSGSYFVYGYSCCIRSIKNFFSSIFSPISKLFSFLKRKKPTKEVASSEDSVVEEKINTEEKGEIVPNEKESV
ncbi:hypothetical protein PRV_00805 [Mycoplasma parvum str. Indiana]|uniref:Uncharacterized protein n=2 Tax=Mycoplasma parvum TaxID=984991 RepID=U5NBK2_9MOLU|nr:hypothetical protein PRV_00805 [Mycoplasma parvum str. Indiana]